MIRVVRIFVLIVLIAPVVMSADCKNATQAFCGLIGGSCSSYNFTNGSCLPLTCSTYPVVTVWSNASFSCVSCYGASKSICMSSCSAYNFYYDNYSTLSSCTTCQDEYSNNCIACDSYTCFNCSTGYQLSNDSQSCISLTCNIPHCQACSNNTCTKCDQFYTPFKNTCICFIQNCQVCRNSACLKCRTGYYLDSTKKNCTLSCIKNCKTCSSLNSCTECSYGYYYTNQTNQCLLNCASIDPYCSLCYTSGICSKCMSNYTLSVNRKECIPICNDYNCNSCINISKCDSCIAGYKLNSSSKNCVEDICSIVNCQICASTSKCKQCKQFYQLKSDNRSCGANCGVDNCQSCQTSTTCKACIDGYKIVSGSCTKICSIQNCGLCTSEQICSACSRGYKLTQNNQSCDFDCGIYKCINCNSTSTCQVCYPGFQLSSNFTCVAVCQEGFFKNSTTNTCQSCPDKCASCDSQGVCLICNYLYYLNNTSFACTACSTIQNCFACDPTSNVCTICNSGYYLVDSVCKSTNNFCSISNCLVCATNTTCQVCNDGFNLAAVNGTCQQIICPSNQYLVDSVCSCGPKSYVQNDLCISCYDTNCLTCTSSICLQCNSGYYATGMNCQSCQSGCQLCDSTGCSSCKTGFVRKGSICKPTYSKRGSSISRKGNLIRCKTGCKICDLDQSQNVICIQASSGYVLVAGKIFVCDPSCLTCANTLQNGSYSICLTCPKRSTLVSGKCQSCKDTNAITCRLLNQSYSLTCLPGYNAQNGVCNACSSNCLKCGGAKSGKCDVGGCLKGFFQSKSSHQCMKCFNGCSVCNLNPNTCSDCGSYKYLKDNICYSCPSNCLQCTNSTICTSCNIGYLLAVDGTCKLPDIVGCTEYDSNIKCTACDQNYILSNGSCVFNIACNNNKTCINCQYNYYLQNSTCILCPTILNCDSCDQLNSSSCIDCASGYYLSASKVCVACSLVGCQTCSSNVTCTSAKDGYYMAMDSLGSSSGQTLPCGGLCATCIYSPLTCLTCKPDSSFFGTQCISNKNYKIKYVGYLKSLGSNTSESSDYQVGFLIKVFPRFWTEMGSALGYKSLSHFNENSNVESVTHQSVAVSFSANSDTTNDPTTAINNAVLTDAQLLSLSVVNSDSGQSNRNLALILGVSIPLGVLLIIIIIVLKVKQQDKVQQQKQKEDTQKHLHQEREGKGIQLQDVQKGENQHDNKHKQQTLGHNIGTTQALYSIEHKQ